MLNRLIHMLTCLPWSPGPHPTLSLQLKRGDGRVLSYGGQAAAAAAKVGRPLDLRGISARIDAGAVDWAACEAVERALPALARLRPNLH